MRMKPLYSFFLALLSLTALAQPPANYYNSATGTGYTLKTQLFNIINNHNDQGYNAIDNFFPTADLDVYYENDGTILDPYSENPSGSDPYNYYPNSDECGNYSGEGDCFNKEHVVPQSYFNQATPMRGDAHHLLPTDGRVNGFRSNYPFGVVGSNLVSQSGISNPTQNGSKLGNNSNTGYAAGYTGVVFEPIDEFKGDIARIIFYFATRYQSQMPGFYTNSNVSSVPAKNMFDGTSAQTIATPFLNIFYQWHLQDPVSQKEIDRNNAIYAYQNNRNPYIDHPEWVVSVWGSALSITTHLLDDGFSVFPNPSTNHTITVRSGIRPERMEIVDIQGRVIQQVTIDNGPTGDISINDIPSGLYFLKAYAGVETAVRKIVIR